MPRVPSLSPGTVVVEKLLSSMGNMVCKRSRLKDNVKRTTRDVVEQVPMDSPIYVDTQCFIEKDMKITWQEIKDIFVASFKEDLEDQ